MNRNIKKNICLCGCFALGHNLLNGQTIKTKIIADELVREFLHYYFLKIDTFGKINVFLLLPKLLYALFVCRNIVIFPAHNSLLVEVPWLGFLNKFFRRKLHYVVIGGWLPKYLDNHRVVRCYLRTFRGIYVETASMKESLEQQGFKNVEIIPNCKPLDLLKEEELGCYDMEYLPLATFSRVMKEKGIEEAAEAVMEANKILGKDIFSITIYGQIEQEKWFKDFLDRMGENKTVSYGGIVPYNQSTSILKDYFALLFPTYYDGEGFAGTLIDAFSAGLPVIATDWKYNSEIVKHHENGCIVPVHDVDAICSELLWAYSNKQKWGEIKRNCLRCAKDCMPERALIPLYKGIMG